MTGVQTCALPIFLILILKILVISGVDVIIVI